MAKTSTLSITVSETGDGQSSNLGVGPQTALQNINTAAPGGLDVPLLLNTGDNTIAIPAGSQGGAGSLLLRGLTATVVVLKVKGIAGDTGVLIDPTRPFVWSIPAGVSTLVINASVGVTLAASWL